MFKKFKGHYAKQKNKKNDRSVISYEDIPLDDYEQEKTEISPEAVKKIIVAVCIALVAGVIVFAFANRDKLTWDNISTWWTYDVLGNAGNGYPVDLVGTEVAANNFTASQGHVAYASDTSFITLNSTANEVANLQLRYSKPILKSSGNKFLTYGLGSTGFQIQSFDSKLYSGEAEYNIYSGDIASNGVYCLVTEGSGYLSTLWVYNNNNNRIYKYSFSEYYITSVALNRDGTGCVASGITSDNGAVSSGIYILDFTKGDPTFVYKIKSDSIIDCEYLNDSRIVIIGQTASYLVKIGDENYKTNRYNDKTLANYCINPDTNSYTVALSRSGDGRSCVLVNYNDKGETVCTIDTDCKADSLSMYKNVTAILDGNKACLYNTEGKLIYSGDTGTGSKRIVLASDSTAYVLSVNQIRFIDFKNPSSADMAELTTKAGS